MRLSRRRFFFNNYLDLSRLELYFCWERAILLREMKSVKQISSTRSLLAQEPMVRRVQNEVGLAIDLLPKRFECFYSPSMKRFCLSLFLICFWIDLPR